MVLLTSICKYMYIELCLFFNENYLTLGQNLDTITLIEFSNIMWLLDIVWNVLWFHHLLKLAEYLQQQKFIRGNKIQVLIVQY